MSRCSSRIVSNFCQDATDCVEALSSKTCSITMSARARRGVQEYVESESRKDLAATFGPPRGASKPSPLLFLKSHTAENRANRKAGRKCSKRLTRKAPLDMTSPPALQASSRDFVKLNALTVIHQHQHEEAKAEEEMDFLTKQDYGKVPAYLTEAKQRLINEKEAREVAEATKVQQDLDAVMTPLPGEERIELLGQLKTKWGILNAAFQKLPLHLDTPSKQRRKEHLEAELLQAEADIQLLQLRPQVMVLHS